VVAGAAISPAFYGTIRRGRRRERSPARARLGGDLAGPQTEREGTTGSGAGERPERGFPPNQPTSSFPESWQEPASFVIYVCHLQEQHSLSPSPPVHLFLVAVDSLLLL